MGGVCRRCDNRSVAEQGREGLDLQVHQMRSVANKDTSLALVGVNVER
jgi:hypothetical protein